MESYPLFIALHVRCIKYRFHLLCMELIRLPNQADRMLVNLDENRNSVGQRRYENSCVKLAFNLFGYSRVLETSNHFCVSSSKDCYTFSPRRGLLTSETKKDIKRVDLSKLFLKQI